MRGLTEQQVNPLPVGPRLPGVLQTDDVVQRFCAGLDDGLSPILLTLDCLPAYFDPITTPADMLPWLAGWLGITLDRRLSVADQRDLLRQTAQLLRWRGTARGLRDSVEFATGIVPEIIEAGGAEWSATAGNPLPGRAGVDVTVRVTVDDPAAVDVRRIEDVVAASVPAHIRFVVEVVTGG